MTRAKKGPISKGKHAVADRRLAFAVRYLANGGDATEAAKHVGYSAKTAKQQGSRLLQDPDVASLVESKRAVVVAQLEQRHDVTLRTVVDELAAVGMGKLTDVASWDEDGSLTFIRSDDLDDRSARIVLEVAHKTTQTQFGTNVSQSIKLQPKVDALKDLRKHLAPNGAAVAALEQRVRECLGSTIDLLRDELPADEFARISRPLRRIWGVRDEAQAVAS